ncbi:MAG: hypothetical protein CMM93_06085 [Rickettsiales bacterium]|nr:hypothetical protein [Rickettsiales bacterium]
MMMLGYGDHVYYWIYNEKHEIVVEIITQIETEKKLFNKIWPEDYEIPISSLYCMPLTANSIDDCEWYLANTAVYYNNKQNTIYEVHFKECYFVDLRTQERFHSFPEIPIARMA